MRAASVVGRASHFNGLIDNAIFQASPIFRCFSEGKILLKPSLDGRLASLQRSASNAKEDGRRARESKKRQGRMTDDPIKLLTDIATIHGADQPNKVAIHFEGRDLTYGEMNRRSDRVAGMLQQAGVKPGDRVAWLGRPSEA